MASQAEVISKANTDAQTINKNFNFLNNKINSLPAPNDAALTIQKNGSTLGTFTADASSPVTVNIAVPVNVTDLADSGNYALKSDITGVYTPAGSASTIAELGALDAEHLGFVYDLTADITTTADFKEGAGKTVKAGNDIGIVNIGTAENPVYKYNVLGGIIDTSAYDAHITDTAIHVTAADKSKWDAKQDALTFDNTPVQNSNNPVKSGGIYTALEAKANTADVYSKTDMDTYLDNCFSVEITDLNPSD